MRVTVLQEFPYSPHGYDNALAQVGIQDLPEHIAAIAIGEGWAAPAEDAEAGGDASPTGPTHALNVVKAVAYVAALDDPAALEAVRVTESAHPGYPGGRTTVLRAIDERQRVLAEPSGPGMADGSDEAEG